MYMVHEISLKNIVSFIAWSFLVYKAVVHDRRFVRGWNGAFIL